jgi:hypothetical protein
MAKRRLIVEMESFGLFEPFDRKKLPKLVRFTEEIPVDLAHEFGYLLRIRGAKGKKLKFRIDHPEFRDDQGRKAPPFTGEEIINKNDYRFFLGDTFWEPLENKAGFWELTTWIDGNEVARKGFNMVYEPSAI